MRIKRFHDGIGFRDWHHFGQPWGTAIRWKRLRPGLFGILFRDGGMHIGLWLHVRIELVAVHELHFQKTVQP
jgi:hypothetical protein